MLVTTPGMEGKCGHKDRSASPPDGETIRDYMGVITGVLIGEGQKEV